ncbi:MAG: hypothetical protein AB7F36_11025 [Reyranellaceae bacterium]
MRSKLWLGIGAFALVQTGNVAVGDRGLEISAKPQAAKADWWGERGWQKGPCGPNQRWVVRNGKGECHDIRRDWNERGDRNERGDHNWHGRGDWNERGERNWNRGNDHGRGERGRGNWERGERGNDNKWERGERG